MGRFGLPPRCAAMRFALAVSLVAATTVSFGVGGAGSALGPVRPITPDETNPRFDEGRDADLSRRGEAITVAGAIDEDSAGAFIGLDNVDLDVPFPAREVGVSGNGCVAAYVSDINADLVRIGTIDRCNPANSRTLDDKVKASLGPFGQPAVDFDGSAVVVPWAAGITYYDIGVSVTRIDLPVASIPGYRPLTGGELRQSDNAVDVSADGNHVVATLARPRHDSTIIAGWDVDAPAMTVLSTADGRAAGHAHSPSISGNGQFVSFVSSEPLVGQPTVAGTSRSWVYVRPLAEPVFTLVSPVDEYSTFSSISEDGSQVAFVTYVFVCSGSCPSRETVRVVWSATPGLTGPLQMEDINDAPGGIVADHGSPVLSGNGRFVAWDTNSGFVLVAASEFGDSRHVMLRERASGLTVSGVNFGAIAAGASAVGTSTVTNTGHSSILVGQMLTTSPTFQVVGGSCGVDVWIPPGATCTVDVRFAAPLAGGPSTAELVVGEVGFRAVSATGALTGSSVPPTTTTPPTDTEPTDTPPTDTPPTTPPTDTAPATTRPPDTTTTATPILSGSPNPLDFGQVAVGIPTVPLGVTITNGGNTAAPITLEIGGDHPDDYQIVSDTCRASPLAPGGSCTVDVRMLAGAGGDRQAMLAVTSGSASTIVALRGQGRFAPQISTSPATITERGVTTIIGQGLPPGATFQLDIPPSTVTVTATADSAGIFQVPLGAFGTLPLGAYEVVLPAEPGVFEEVRAHLLVVVGTFQPQGPTSAAFGDNLLVTRN